MPHTKVKTRNKREAIPRAKKPKVLKPDWTPPPAYERKVRVLNADKQIEALIRKHKYLAMDIETPFLHATQNLHKPITIAVEVGGTKKYWDLREEVPQFLAKYFADPSVLIIIHGSIFDCTWLSWHYKWEFTNIGDTMLMEEILLGIGEPPNHVNTKSPEYLEKYSAKLIYTLPRHGLAAHEKESQSSFIGMTTEPLTPKQKKYILDDVAKLRKLYDHQMKWAKAWELQETIWLENNVAEVAYRMKVTGMPFDLPTWLRLADANKKLYDKMVKKLNVMTDYAIPNWNSPQRVKKYFSEVHGITIKSLSDLADDDGEPNQEFMGLAPELDLLIRIRAQVGKYVNTYGHTWLETKYTDKKKKGEWWPTIGPDGRIHSHTRQIISTGRMSSSKPNLTQLPSNNENNKLHVHRIAFTASKGHKLVSQDFKGQELGIMAAAAKYTPWVDAILRGDDVHSIEARAMDPTGWDAGKEKGCTFPRQCNCKKHKKKRGDSKKITFGMPYGKTKRGLAPELQISEYEAQQRVEAWKFRNRKLANYLEENGQYAVEHWGARTMPRFNRWRNLVLFDYDKHGKSLAWKRKNQGKNTPIQGTGGDMLKLALWKVYCYLRDHKLTDKVRILLCVHDQIITEAVTAFSKQWAKIFAKLCEEAADEVLGIKGLVTADPEIMDYWKPKNE